MPEAPSVQPRSTSAVVPCIIAAVALGGAITFYAMSGSQSEVLAPKSLDGPEENPESKAEVPTESHDFGAMAIYSQKSHTFRFKSAGKEPLEVHIHKGLTTCSCTVSEGKSGFFNPGEEIEVKMTWYGKKAGKGFEQQAVVLTSDPNNKQIRFRVKGDIVRPISIEPEYQPIPLGDCGEKPVTAKVKVFTTLFDDLNIIKATSKNPLFQLSHRKLNKDELEEVGGKAGNELTITVMPVNNETASKPGMEWKYLQTGMFRQAIHLKLDRKLHRRIEGGPRATFRSELHDTLDLYVVGNRLGPIKFRGVAGAWIDDSHRLSLGTIPAGRGSTGEFELALTCPPDEDVQVQSVKSDSDQVIPSFRLVADEGTVKVYRITVKIPKDRKPALRGGDDPVRLMIRTNHPHHVARQIAVRVTYAAQ